MMRYAPLLACALLAACPEDPPAPPHATAVADADAATEPEAAADTDAAADMDAEAVADAVPDADAIPEADAVPDAEAVADADAVADAEAVADAAGLDPNTALLGHWIMTGFQDSGGPVEPVPPAQATHFVFRGDGSFNYACDGPPGSTWSVSADWIEVTIDVGAGPITWTILVLTPDTFHFSEGGDVFQLARTSPCP